MSDIPPITDEMGRSWRQPPLSEILIDDQCAMMGRESLLMLRNYSATDPTGVYEGKMWRAEDGEGGWYLRWFGKSNRPNMVSNNQRRIVIVD